MTLRQFAARFDRFNEATQREDFRCGLIASVTANFSMGKDPKQPPLMPQDFFPNLPQPQEETEAPPDQMIAILQAWASMNNAPKTAAQSN
jgi:hypothetical protein